MTSSAEGRFRGRRGRRRAQSRHAFRSLALQLSADHGERSGGRTLLLTSAERSPEAVVACRELARFLSEEDGARVLLVDAGFIDPVLSASLDGADRAGLSDLLLGAGADRGTLEDAMLTTSTDRVRFLPAGRAGAAAGALRIADRLRALLAGFERENDWVILYGPPVLEDPTLLTLPGLVDGVLLLSVEGRTRLVDLDAARDVLASCGAKHVRLLLSTPVKRRVALRARGR